MGRIGVGVVAVNLREPIGQRAVHVDGNRPHLVDGKELHETEDHPLGSPQAERRDDHLALVSHGPGDDRVKLFHQAVIRVEFAIAVGALRDQDVDVSHRGRVGKQAGVAPAQVAGIDEPPAPAVFLEIDLDDGRAEDVPCVLESQAHSRNDLGCFRVADPAQPLHDPFHVQQVEQRLGCFNVGMPEVGVPHILALNSRTVAKHHARDVGRGRSGVNRPLEPRLDHARKPADVVVVRVRDDHRVHALGIEIELAIRTVRVDAIGIK